jgi:pSer/pThr/pTyr-binding forkhead associated (FHA) protein
MNEPDQPRLPSPRELQAIIEAERTGLPFLRWYDGADEQKILLLREDLDRVTLGRREQRESTGRREAHLALTWDPEVSRAHAVLEEVGDEWTLVDDGLSRNGSFVNGSRIGGRRRLHNRDRMCFGSTVVVFHDPADDQEGSSTARGPDTPVVPLSENKRKVLIALCRPVATGASATPATNPQIAAEVYLSVEAVKSHLRELFERFDLGELAQNEKRNRLVSIVLNRGILTPRDF